MASQQRRLGPKRHLEIAVSIKGHSRDDNHGVVVMIEYSEEDDEVFSDESYSDPIFGGFEDYDTVNSNVDILQLRQSSPPLSVLNK